MAKTRISSLQEKMGFMDTDLTTPKHDEIMLWLEDNIETVIDQLLIDRKWKEEEIEKARKEADAWVQGQLQKFDFESLKNWKGLGDLPEKCRWNFTEQPEWEFPVSSGKYIVGFLDMALEVEYNLFSVDFPEERECPPPPPPPPTPEEAARMAERNKKISTILAGGGIRINQPIFNGEGYIPKWDIYRRRRGYLFEVKSAIPSLGELIRQIHLYEQYQQGFYVVVSPDTRYRKAIENQNIEFVEYPH